MIVVDQVSKYYGTTAAVRDLKFDIEEGECVGFLGLNGAGKSTTLRMLSCLLLPTAGRITIEGFDAESQSHEIRKLVGYLPDSPPLYPEMTVEGFLRFAGAIRQMDRAAIDRRLPQVVETTALEEVTSQAIGTLSHGYRQRVGIAQAIIHEPSLLILDEPIQGLDPVQIVEMRQLIRSLRGKHTILLSTHILSEIQQTCDRVLMLHRGAITAQGTEQELIERFGVGGTIRIEVRGDIDAILKSIEPVTRGRVREREAYRDRADAGIRKERTGTDTWLLELEATVDLREELAATLVKEHFGLLRLDREATGLEHIFVDLSRDREVEA